MDRTSAILAGAFLLALAAAPRSAAASSFGTVEDCWDSFVQAVGVRDEVEVLNCYEPKLRGQFQGDKTAAGRARLGVHMAELFELLFRDYDYQVADQKDEGQKVTHTIKFRHKKKNVEHHTTVVFTSDGDRWFISKNPELPSFLTAGKGSIVMVGGIVVAVVAVGLVAKKLLGG